MATQTPAGNPSGTPATTDAEQPPTTHEMTTSPTDTTSTPAAVKHFVLDTNVLLHNPNALFVFQDNHVIIPYPVIEELDKMKRRDDDIGRNARAVIRWLDLLRRSGKLTDGVNWGEVEAIAQPRVRRRARRLDRQRAHRRRRIRPPPGDRGREPRQPHHRGRQRPDAAGRPRGLRLQGPERASRATRWGSRPRISRTRKLTPTSSTAATAR